MSIHKSYRKMCPDMIVNDLVTNIIKTVPLRVGYKTIRVTLKTDKPTDKTLTFCALTTLSVVCRKGCLVDIVDVSVKSAPKNDKLRRCIPVARLFAREGYFFNTVLPELEEFQTGVRQEEGFQGAPALIAASVESEGEEAIILRNNGSEWTPRYERWVGELTKEHILAVLKEFGRFHALGFAFGKVNPEKFKEFKVELQDGFLGSLENKHSLDIIHGNLKAALKFFGDEEVVKKLKRFNGEVDGLVQDALNCERDGEVLAHGDVTTNVLFCYEKTEVGHVVSRAKFTDWQLVKFGSPVLDLALFFFANSSFDDLSNLDEFLKDYHIQLGKSLKEFKCDVEDIFSYDKLQKHWNKYAKFGLALTFLNLGILSQEFSKRPNANVEDLSCEEFLECFVRPPNDEFIRKIKDVVKYCVAKGLL